MDTGLPLHKLYHNQVLNPGVPAYLDQAVDVFLKREYPNPAMHLPEGKWDAAAASPWAYLEKCRELLGANLIINMIGEDAKAQQVAFAANLKSHSASLHPNWSELQLAVALRAFNLHLSGSQPPKITPLLSESGAVPLEAGGHWPWAEIPHVRFHAELGLLWCLLGHESGNPELIAAAVRLAEWHLNTLDHDFYPFEGLFAQEADGSLPALLSYNYLMYHSLALLAGMPEWEFIARRQLEHLDNIQRHDLRIPPLAVLLESWLARKNLSVQSINVSLPSKIYDPHTALVGWRSPSHNIVCTMFGGCTGLGCFRSQDVHIVNYGPQHLPLGDCEGFGIEGGEFSQRKHPRVRIETSEEGFEITSQARLASPNPKLDSHALFRNGTPSGFWIDARQKFQKGTLDIEAQFLALKNLDLLAFTFFAKAKWCLVNNKKINPRSLNRYQGEIHHVKLGGEKAVLEIEASHTSGELQIVPLAGGDNFWGADFLVAYLLNPDQSAYKWKVASSQ